MTANTVFKGFVAGLIFSLIAMGIVLIYRSSRIINFAVADLGVPAAAVLAICVSINNFTCLRASSAKYMITPPIYT